MVEMLEMMLMTRMCISFHLPPSTAALSLLNIPPEYLNILPAPSPPALPNYMQFSHRIEWYICTENIWIFWPVYSDIFVQTKDRADSQLWTISSVAPLYVQCTLCTLSIFHVHSSHPEVGVIFLPHWAIIGWRGWDRKWWGDLYCITHWAYYAHSGGATWIYMQVRVIRYIIIFWNMRSF